MMMIEFLLFLGKLNLAMGAAIAAVYLLRRPLRAQFGAPIAYALWLLVPITGLASLLPPRAAATLSAHSTRMQNPGAPISAVTQTAHPGAHITEQLTGQIVPMQSMNMAHAAAINYATLLFAVWALGAVFMVLYVAWLQARFHAAARLHEAGILAPARRGAGRFSRAIHRTGTGGDPGT
jgi:beta-lactamase regulating signal transducer with metallopeptidase domain